MELVKFCVAAFRRYYHLLVLASTTNFNLCWLDPARYFTLDDNYS